MEDRYDRYAIKDTVDGLKVEAKQSKTAINLMTACLMAAASAYYFGPYGEKIFSDVTYFWVLEEFMGFMILLSVAGFFHTESFLITKDSIINAGFLGKMRVVSRSNVKKIALTCRAEPDSAPEWKIDFVDASGRSVGMTFDFPWEKDAKGMLKALKMRMNIPITELKR